jgi:hypothetical protein
MDPRGTIDKLKREGYRVNVRHERPILVPIHKSARLVDGNGGVFEGNRIGFGTRYELETVRKTTPSAFFGMKGGSTEVTIKDADGLVAATAVSYCRPDDPDGPGDQFNRKLGLRIALGRAVKKLQEVPW